MFSVNTGTVGTASAAQRSLTEEELAKDTFAVRVSVTERGRISFWLDGNFVASYDEPNFTGGYIGFNAFKSRVVFSDLLLRVGESDMPAGDIFTVVNGNWNYASGVLTGQNASSTDRFIMTDISVPSGKAFSVEATATMRGGSNISGIVFGVSDPTAPASGWYCANVALASKIARLFSVKTGTLGTGSGTSRALSEEQRAKTEFARRLEVSGMGLIRYYVDGALIYEIEEPSFAGGYIGFNTFRSAVDFSNLVITVDGETQLLSDMSLTAGEKQFSLNPAAYYNDIDLGDFGGGVVLCLRLPAGYTAKVGQTAFVNGAYTFTPAPGRNLVQIDIWDSYERKTSTVLEIWREIPDELIYTDTYRPKFHVTPPKNFMNDPNGLFYNESTGEYHAYYQWNPTGMSIGNQVWGHAVSTDLLHWENKGIALDRDGNGARMYSGSAVVDKDNTSGLFDSSTAPENRVVLLYTIRGASMSQGLAYSSDGGYTFTKYENNPVIASSAYDSTFRDPKILWIEEKQLWLMVVAGDPMELYTSPDLIHWTSQGVMRYADGTVIESECPSLLALPLDGDENNIKYVYTGSGRFYVVGDLIWDGNTVQFVPEQGKNTTLFYSSPHYATQNFYNDAADRTLLMSWMRDSTSGYVLDNKYWHGIQSMPYEASLVTQNGKMVLRFDPIGELEGLKRDALYQTSNITLTNSTLALDGVKAVYGIFDMKAKLSPGASLVLGMREGEGYASTFTVKYLTNDTVFVTMNTKNSGPIVRGVQTATVACDADGSFTLKTLLDNSVIETFTNDGKVFADFVFPPEGADGISLTAVGEVQIDSFAVYAAE